MDHEEPPDVEGFGYALPLRPLHRQRSRGGSSASSGSRTTEFTDTGRAERGPVLLPKKRIRSRHSSSDETDVTTRRHNTSIDYMFDNYQEEEELRRSQSNAEMWTHPEEPHEASIDSPSKNSSKNSSTLYEYEYEETCVRIEEPSESENYVAVSHRTSGDVDEKSIGVDSQASHMTPNSASMSGATSFATPVQSRFRRARKRDANAIRVGFDGQLHQLPLDPEQSSTGMSLSSTIHSQSVSLNPRSLADSCMSTAHSLSPGSQRYVKSPSGNDSKSYGTSTHYSPSAPAKSPVPLQQPRVEQSRERKSKDDDFDINSTDDFPDDFDDPIVCWNITLPTWVSKWIREKPSLHRISLFVVHLAPCFWCSPNASQDSHSDRGILNRLNCLCLFFTVFQFAASLWLAWLLASNTEGGLSEEFAPHFWNINGSVFAVGFIALLIILTCLCTTRVIKEVDLVGAIRYLWFLLWLVPLECFFAISLFDYHVVTSVWVRHWWGTDQMSWFRDFFCPDDTADNLCMVPIEGGEKYQDEDSWCMDQFNSTSCSEVRDDAQFDMQSRMVAVYGGLGIWACVLVMLLLLMIHQLERIISKPIVQKARESNVPGWLLLPTIGNTLAGAILLFSRTSLLSRKAGAENWWIGVLYLVSASLFLTALVTAWFLSSFSIQNSTDKKTKSTAVMVFLGVMVTNTLILAAMGISSLFLSINIVESPISEEERGTVACLVDRGTTCTSCDAFLPQDVCPEWTLDEVTKIWLTQLKQSATVCCIFIVYAISVARFGFVLRKHLALYQIDYV